MNRMILKSKVGSDGVLQVAIPFGLANANREVQVTIDPAQPRSDAPSDYSAWLDSIAGRWQGDFERPPQGVAEEREPLQ
ncbi:MAG: hypothetical protein JSS02_12620 [Planctomycetes bacterium]|nr:hypothetical protein [Planctomycetota bacterium]